MKTMSKGQEQLMNALLVLAGGDSELVERAFEEVPPREGSSAPALNDIVYFLLRETGREDLVPQMKEKLEGERELTGAH